MPVIFAKTFKNLTAIPAGGVWSPTLVEAQLSEHDQNKYGPFNEAEFTNNSTVDDTHIVLKGDPAGETELLLGSVTKVFKKSDGQLFHRPIIANRDGAAAIAIGDILITVRRVI